MHLGYKKLRNNRIAVLEITGQTNEQRPNIVNAATAKHRCSEALVVAIYDMFDKNITFQKGRSLWDASRGLVYRVGKKVRVRNFDQNLEVECSNGVHYFLSEECAFFWSSFARAESALLLHKWSGEFKDWDADGKLIQQATFVNGKRHGPCKTFCDMFNEDAYYKDGLLHGPYKMYYSNGQLNQEGYYHFGKKVGDWTHFDKNGNLVSKYSFKNGKLHGRQQYWEKDYFGHDQYTNGVRNGLSTEWFSNDQLKKQCYYLQDKLHGVECRWSSNGQLLLEREWKNGKKHGKQTTFYENGMVEQILHYSNGHLVRNIPSVRKRHGPRRGSKFHHTPKVYDYDHKRTGGFCMKCSYLPAEN